MEDYLSCCRLCLSPGTPGVENLDLFGEICVRDSIPQKILCVLSILVHPQDSLPQQVCSKCFECVKTYFKFHRTSSLSTSHLLTFLEKDDDISKNVYANMLKNFQKKNYSHLDGNASYEVLLQEKFDEVKNSVYDVTSRFSNTKKNLNSLNSEVNRIYIDHCKNTRERLLNQSRITATKNVTDVSPLPCPTFHERYLLPSNETAEASKKALSKTTFNSAKHASDITEKTVPGRNNVPAKKGGFGQQVKKSEVDSKKGEIKIDSFTLFRCKLCLSAYPNKEENCRHEASVHKCIVKVNKYYGPADLHLEEDAQNQVKKLSWPFRKRRAPCVNQLISSQVVKTFPAKDVNPKILPLVNEGKRSLDINDLHILPEISTPPPKKIRIGPKSKIMRVKNDESLDLDNIPLSKLDLLKKKKEIIGPKTKKTSFIKATPTNSDISCSPHNVYFESQCKYCKCKLNSLSSKDFLKHLNIEQCNNITAYSCSLCREDFCNKQDMFDEHRRKCCMTNFFSQEDVCSKCCKLIKSPSLEDHLVNNHKTLFKCFMCPAEFNQKDCLTNHLQKCTFKPTIQKMFTCETCKTNFVSLKALKSHSLSNHTHHYINSDISLDFSNVLQGTGKNECNVLRYQKDNYIACNSKGSFVCGIKKCNKVLETIFELETHIQSHSKKVRKISKKRCKNKKKFTDDSYVSFYRMISICDDYIIKKTPVEPDVSVDEDFDIHSKDHFLLKLGLKKNTENHKVDNMGDLDYNIPSQDSQGIFELSDNKQLGWQSLEQKQPQSPVIVTLDSDED
uniref:Uncharacterized protein n=1 Tax=Cacopsylla melanoneura TaxID=428564 RepID=A0A8D8YZ23_9HEMI